jgi:hypothetical protein
MSDISGAVSRSLAAIAIEEPQQHDEGEQMLAPLEGGDMAQNIQFPVSGNASAKAAWTSVEVFWRYPFFQKYDKSRTDSNLDNPTFTYGVEMLTDAPVVVFVAVRDWLESDEGWQIGARMRVSCFSPGFSGNKKIQFQGIVHCTFMGWAAPAEDETDTSRTTT